MLKRFLPIFLKKPQEKNLNPEINFSDNSNLLDSSNSGFHTFGATNDTTLENLFKFIILIVCCIFLFLIAFNFYLDTRLLVLKNTTNALEKELLAFEDNISFSREVVNKINLYKKISSNTYQVGNKLKFITENLGEVLMTSINVSDKKFELVAKGPSALSFSLLLHTYLNSNLISEIVIKSATLNIVDNTYEVTLEGVFN